MIIFIAIVGFIIWTPVLYLTSLHSFGPLFTSTTEWIDAMAPVLSLAIPASLCAYRGWSPTPIAWTIATAPLLAIVGVLTSTLLGRAIFENLYGNESATTAANYGLWVFIGVMLHLLGRVGLGART